MRPINQCLNQNLVQICQKAMQLDALNELIKKYLPDNIKDHCNVGSFSGGNLKLVIKNPIWATELRYTLPELRNKLRSEAKLYQLTSIKIVVGSLVEPAPAKKNKSSWDITKSQQIHYR